MNQSILQFNFTPNKASLFKSKSEWMFCQKSRDFLNLFEVFYLLLFLCAIAQEL